MSQPDLKSMTRFKMGQPILKWAIGEWGYFVYKLPIMIAYNVIEENFMTYAVIWLAN